MSIVLAPHIEARIRQKIESGGYASGDEVVEAALRLLDEREENLGRLRAAIAIGEEQAARGETVPFTPELAAQMKRDARRMAAEGCRPDPDVCP